MTVSENILDAGRRFGNR